MKSYPKIIDRILDIVRESKTFCIVGHIRPDGDCVGSQLGLTLALQNEGKKAVCWNEDCLPQKYKFLDPEGLFQKTKGRHEIRLCHRHRLRELRAPGQGRQVYRAPESFHQH